MSNRNMAINLVANLISFTVALAIQFFLTPFIVKNVGSDAYGFISLANNFVTYISLITVALNSMAGRYVSIRIYQKDIEGANKYFSSVIIANIVICLVLMVPSILGIVFLDKIIEIPKVLVNDVRILFTLVILGFFITLITSILSIALFVTNKLYLTAIRNIEGSIIRAILTVLLFSLLPTKVFYICLINIVFQIYIAIWNIYYTKKFIPNVKFSKKNFDLLSIKELISSGVWNMVSQLSSILNEGLDLLISNLFIGATPMGILAIAKTVPSMIMSIIGVLSGVFAPDFTQQYAAGKFDEMVKLLKRSIKLLGIFVNIPIAGLIVFGDIFYKLWVPSQDAKQLQVLSILTIMCVIISGSTAAIYTIFTVTNNVKINSLVTLGQGIINTIIVIILLKTTNFGIYAVAGVSSVLAIIKNLFFTFPYAAKCIKQKWYVLYIPALRTATSVFLVSIVCYIFRYLFRIDTWSKLIIFGVISGSIGCLLNVSIILNRNEKDYLFKFIKKNYELINKL